MNHDQNQARKTEILDKLKSGEYKLIKNTDGKSDVWQKFYLIVDLNNVL